MIDLAQLRRAQPVITVAEYLELHGLDPKLETGSGAWDREAYHNVTNGSPRPTLLEIPNEEFDPERTTRVDRLPEHKVKTPKAPKSGSAEAMFLHDLGAKYDKWNTADLSDVVAALEAAGFATWKTDAQMVRVLARYGLSPLYTFHGRRVRSFVELYFKGGLTCTMMMMYITALGICASRSSIPSPRWRLSIP